MKALATTTLPRGDWRLEVKFDGYRAVAVCRGRNVRLWSRNHEPMNADFPEVIDALQRMEISDAVLDGEVVALDRSGRSVFQLLQRRGLEKARVPIVYYVFDLLRLAGVSWLDEPIEQRKETLARLLRKTPPTVKLSPVFDVAPEQMLREIERQGLEGLIAKRPGSLYEPGRRSGAWLKYRVARDQEFVIGGFTPPGGSRSHIGALLLGYYAGRDLRYAGKVGTGFDEKTLADLHRLLKPFVRRTSAFADLPGANRGEARRLIGGSPDSVTWLEPRVVCQVRFNEWTDGGRL
ncbi:MAG TPA: non-homologous end-joining DNA ligase, partial [Opitutaceae bacterium]